MFWGSEQAEKKKCLSLPHVFFTVYQYCIHPKKKYGTFCFVEPLTLPPSEPREDGESAGGKGGSDDPSQPFRGRGHSGHGAPPEGGIRAAQGPCRSQEAQAQRRRRVAAVLLQA